jgi:tetratricopeptide (TPR) repeat protein
MSGRHSDAMTEADGLIETAEASRNPFALTFAIHAYAYAFHDAEPRRALECLRRGLAIAQESGNRFTESQLVHSLFRSEANYGDPVAALDYAAAAIRLFHDSGGITTIRNPLAALAAFFDRLGQYVPAATIAGFAASPMARAAVPEIDTAIAHLREALGQDGYESLARDGMAMTATEAAAYAYEQIDLARANLTSS